MNSGLTINEMNKATNAEKELNDPKIHEYNMEIKATDARVVKWLCENFPHTISKNIVKKLACITDPSVIILSLYKMITPPPVYPSNLLDIAVKNNHLEIIKWLQNNTDIKYDTKTITRVIKSGNLELFKLMHEHKDKEIMKASMKTAISYGQLDIVKWLYENTGEDSVLLAINYAAINGQLEILKWLDANTPATGTSDAIDGASECGHIDIVKWLYLNREDGITIKVIYNSSKNGHLNIIKWMYNCSISIKWDNSFVNIAAENGHLETLIWFYENKNQDLSIYTNAFTLAANNGHLDVLKFLYKKYEESFDKINHIENILKENDLSNHVHSFNVTSETLENVCKNGHLETLVWLHETFPNVEITDKSMLYAVIENRQNIIEYLHKQTDYSGIQLYTCVLL